MISEQTLKELAAKWDKDAIPPDCIDGSEEAKLGNALAKGIRLGLETCARDLRILVKLLGEQT
jgi:hypothetical protein